MITRYVRASVVPVPNIKQGPFMSHWLDASIILTGWEPAKKAAPLFTSKVEVRLAWYRIANNGFFVKLCEEGRPPYQG